MSLSREQHREAAMLLAIAVGQDTRAAERAAMRLFVRRYRAARDAGPIITTTYGDGCGPDGCAGHDDPDEADTCGDTRTHFDPFGDAAAVVWSALNELALRRRGGVRLTPRTERLIKAVEEQGNAPLGLTYGEMADRLQHTLIGIADALGGIPSTRGDS